MRNCVLHSCWVETKSFVQGWGILGWKGKCFPGCWLRWYLLWSLSVPRVKFLRLQWQEQLLELILSSEQDQSRTGLLSIFSPRVGWPGQGLCLLHSTLSCLPLPRLLSLWRKLCISKLLLKDLIFYLETKYAYYGLCILCRNAKLGRDVISPIA